jgi:enamine deaminase RidA (YjgF/YER057c/UK114 family)
MKAHILGGALIAVLGAAALPAAEIARFKAAGPTPALILQGVLVPAGAETFYLSGQLASPIDPAKPVTAALTIEDFGDTKTQTVSILTKIKGLLAAHGYAMTDVIKMTVFVAGDPKLGGKMDFAGMNDGYKQFFGTAENPNVVARSTVQVAALAAPWALVEIEVMAAKMPK